MRTAAILLLTLLVTAACGSDERRAASQQPAKEPAAAAAPARLTPEQLGELGAELRKDPARADELLARRGLTQQAFEKAIREVTEDPEASKRYAVAYRRASA